MSTPLRLEGVLDCGIPIGSSLLPIRSSCSCNGDGCEVIDPWPIHQVRHRNIGFLRLCTSCVLKHHPGSFCCSCFEFLNSYERPPLAQCLKCPSVVHVYCLPDPSLAPVFLCPSCEIPSTFSFSYFSYSKKSTNRAFDLLASKVLLTAARIAAASMSRAVALAKSDAEKKVKEAALARRKARDMLESTTVISKKDKMYFAESAAASSADTAEMEIAGPKKKAPRPSRAATTIVAHKRAKNRNREKWMRFSEPFELVQKGTQRSDSGTGSLKFAGESMAICDEKKKVNKKKKKKKKKKGISFGVYGRIGKEEREIAEADKGSRKPQSNQDPSVPKPATGAMGSYAKNNAAILQS